MKKFIFLAGVFLLLLAASFLGFQRFLSCPESFQNAHFPFVFEIVPGQTLPQITSRLREQRMIQNEKFFLLYLKLTQQDKKIKRGEYEIKSALNMVELISLLSSGKSREHLITIPEGYNIFEIAKIFEEKKIASQVEFLKMVRDPMLVQNLLSEKQLSLEGYLFPETYAYTKYTDLKTILAQMVAKFKDEFKVVGFPSQFALSRHQIVTLASIIEKETGAAEERPLIASVFLNRLKKGMRLQTDPTVIYGIAYQTGDIPKNISRSDLQTPTTFNTYIINGLPPGPISNPGRLALKAVLNPAPSEYLFFVSKNEGRHFFSESLEKHNQAVREFQMNPKAREGKSWRHLNQSQPDRR